MVNRDWAGSMSQVRIHPSAFIGEGVFIGSGVTVGPNAVVLGPCTIEDGVWIGGGSNIGAPPEITSARQNSAWAGELEHLGVRIGAGAVIREFAVVHQGSVRETTIGAGSWILNRAYVAHDVLIGEGVTLSAGVSIGGHCQIDNRVNVGMNASVHQHRIIGAGAMIGMGTPLTRDVPPFAMVYGAPPRLRAINTVGMSRAGIGETAISALAASYRAGDLFPQVGSSLEEIRAELDWWQQRKPPRVVVPAL